jgi:hypothetical protein
MRDRYGAANVPTGFDLVHDRVENAGFQNALVSGGTNESEQAWGAAACCSFDTPVCPSSHSRCIPRVPQAFLYQLQQETLVDEPLETRLPVLSLADVIA